MDEKSEAKSITFKDRLNAVKIVALIGTIFLIFYSIIIILNGIVSLLYFVRFSPIIYFYQIGLGVIYIIFTLFLLKVLEIIGYKGENFGSPWPPLLIVGVLVTFGTFMVHTDLFFIDNLTDTFYINPFGVIRYYIFPLPGILLIIAAVLDILTKKRKEIKITKFLSLIGAGITIFEFFLKEVLFIDYQTVLILGFLALISIVILILSMSKIEIRIPYSWWVVFVIGIVIIWSSLLGGVVILAVVILILWKY